MTVKELKIALDEFDDELEVITKKTEIFGNIAFVNSVRKDRFGFVGSDLPCVLLTDEFVEHNTTHELKISCKYYNDILIKGKSFEIRKNDRNYHVGDRLTLKEFDGYKYTGRVLVRWINYIHNGTGEFGLEKGYCILGLTDEPYDKLDRRI